MTRPSPAPGSASETVTVTDFELVRNAEGAWLLVMPSLPDALTDNPLALNSLAARLEGDMLVLESSVFDLRFASLVASHYGKALAADRPRELLLCIVDDDGLKRLSRIVPFHG